jgi:hypothetical protein
MDQAADVDSYLRRRRSFAGSACSGGVWGLAPTVPRPTIGIPRRLGSPLVTNANDSGEVVSGRKPGTLGKTRLVSPTRNGGHARLSRGGAWPPLVALRNRSLPRAIRYGLNGSKK